MYSLSMKNLLVEEIEDDEVLKMYEKKKKGAAAKHVLFSSRNEDFLSSENLGAVVI